MRKKFRKILGCLTLLFLLTSCGGMTNSSEITKLETKETQQEKQQTNKQNVEKNTCTVSIECSTILDNEKELKASKKEFVPSDGWILEPIEVKYETGDTVYDILARVCKEKKIQLDSNYTPLYSAYYVKGINQFYEFDCGERSGWTYSVNGYFPNYGCSKYEVSDGDVIEWSYTCDLGKDVGDEFEEE